MRERFVTCQETAKIGPKLRPLSATVGATDLKRSGGGEWPRWESNPHFPCEKADFKSAASAVPPRGREDCESRQFRASVDAPRNQGDHCLEELHMKWRVFPSPKPFRQGETLRTALDPGRAARGSAADKVNEHRVVRVLARSRPPTHLKLASRITPPHAGAPPSRTISA